METKEELEARLIRLSEARAAHKAIIKIHSKGITYPRNGDQCAFNGCNKAGSRTSSVRGSDFWYCHEHCA